jgi:fumarate hydratase, class II
MDAFRTASDALGEVKIPAAALWDAATQRALALSPISSRRFPRPFIGMLGLLKAIAAEVHAELGLLQEDHAKAIAAAARAVAAGDHDDQFPLDIFQTGSGTSTNMNANEVIANLANRSFGGDLGRWAPLHPNDHVNKGQSSNDVIPSVLHLAAAVEIDHTLIPALEALRAALAAKAHAFDAVLTTGRTHLQDAMPIRLGQVFSGFARQAEKGIERLRRVLPLLGELALGGTAVGTGFGAPAGFAAAVCERLSAELLLDFRPAVNHFEALSSRSALVEAGGCLTACATSLVRIADDIRLLASGPRLGLGELRLPALMPGSSIMPGKVNPVVPEMVCQVGTQVIANGTAIAVAAQAGHLQLNTMLPLLASNLLESIAILASAAKTFADRCIAGIEADEERCSRGIEQSLALATALVPKIGYAQAAAIANEAAARGATVREVALARGVGTEEELDLLLDVDRMTRGQ